MDYPTSIDPRRTIKVQDSKLESSTVKSLFFTDELCRKAKPGQYVMIWIPGVDEVPMSLSRINEEGRSSITFQKVGEGTTALYNTKKAESLGIRGPYGNWFTLMRGKNLVVGGGTGLAALYPLMGSLVKLGSEVTCVIGGKTREDLLFLHEINNLLKAQPHKLVVTTEDGNYGRKGLVTDAVKDLLINNRFDGVYTCGPELMMKRVFDLSEYQNIPLEVCIERIVKCSLGICGSCVIGEYRVCKEGLILNSQQLQRVRNEFGKFVRDLNGRKQYY